MGRIQQSKNPSNIHWSSFIHPFIPIEKHQSNRSRMASRTHNSSSETMGFSPRNCPQLWELLNDSKISDLCKKQPEPKSESPWKSSKMPAAQAISEDLGGLMHFFLEEPLGFFWTLAFHLATSCDQGCPGCPKAPVKQGPWEVHHEVGANHGFPRVDWAMAANPNIPMGYLFNWPKYIPLAMAANPLWYGEIPI